MIETTQLRLGNYLSLSGSIAQVAAIHSESVCIEGVLRPTDNPQYPYEYNPILASDDSLQPILLSDFRLQHLAGSIPTAHGKAFLLKPGKATYLIYPDKENGGYFIGLDFRGELIRAIPRSFYNLHELQNIYYSIYRHELIMSDTKVRNILNL